MLNIRDTRYVNGVNANYSVKKREVRINQKYTKVAHKISYMYYNMILGISLP